MSPAIGTTVTHRCYVAHDKAHYAGNLVDGAWSLAAFGDVATEMCILTDGDEGLFASYADVQFRAPVRAGDVVEVRAELVSAGNRSRVLHFTAYVVARGASTPERPGAAAFLDPPLLATEATGTVVVPPPPGVS
ncbi:hotdog fold domain-containing protein [Nocardioides sp. AE5]|uniref:3-aminobutyryl-CoA ammonia lyase n=1 Tax=Nocardioides sp. AE5 TaxID=2962573 RepID=UPI0028829BC0|nr:hotdog fold domain-containing protein [Nocardioides sp. AE5]MDT0203544.1 hotdog fold domain-containing protein [Nocardioides sp. AE5]